MHLVSKPVILCLYQLKNGYLSGKKLFFTNKQAATNHLWQPVFIVNR
jgi:hypothetical protein